MTPTAVQTASWKGIMSLNVGVVRTTRVPAAPTMPISPHNIQAGKNAPNNSNEGASAREQPVSVQLVTIRKTALGGDGSVIVRWAQPYAISKKVARNLARNTYPGHCSALGLIGVIPHTWSSRVSLLVKSATSPQDFATACFRDATAFSAPMTTTKVVPQYRSPQNPATGYPKPLWQGTSTPLR